MPATQIKLNHRDESLDGIFYRRDMQEHLRVAHEAIFLNVSCQAYVSVNAGARSIWGSSRKATYFVILSNILRGSRMNVGRTTRLRSAPGRNCEMIWDRTIR